MVNDMFAGEKGGIVSMRRVLAFIFGLTAVFCGAFSVFWCEDWKIVIIAFLAPGALSCLMMFFTTWDDVSKVVSFKKEHRE